MNVLASMTSANAATNRMKKLSYRTQQKTPGPSARAVLQSPDPVQRRSSAEASLLWRRMLSRNFLFPSRGIRPGRSH